MFFPIKFTKFNQFNLYVCMLFVIPLEKFHRYGDITITGGGPLLGTYTHRASRVLLSATPTGTRESVTPTVTRESATPTVTRESATPTVTRDISFYGYLLQGHVSLVTPIPGHLTVKLSLPVLTTYVCRGWDSNTQSSACETNAL